MRVGEAVRSCGQAQDGLATPAQLRAAGITRSTLSRALGRAEVNRIHPGVYARSSLADWPVYSVTHLGVAPELVQHVRAALLSLGDTATAAGRTAACLRGWGLLVEPVKVIDVAVVQGRSGFDSPVCGPCSDGGCRGSGWWSPRVHVRCG